MDDRAADALAHPSVPNLDCAADKEGFQTAHGEQAIPVWTHGKRQKVFVGINRNHRQRLTRRREPRANFVQSLGKYELTVRPYSAPSLKNAEFFKGCPDGQAGQLRCKSMSGTTLL
jgi:hypothetical protein